MEQTDENRSKTVPILKEKFEIKLKTEKYVRILYKTMEFVTNIETLRMGITNQHLISPCYHYSRDF